MSVAIEKEVFGGGQNAKVEGETGVVAMRREGVMMNHDMCTCLE